MSVGHACAQVLGMLHARNRLRDLACSGCGKGAITDVQLDIYIHMHAHAHVTCYCEIGHHDSHTHACMHACKHTHKACGVLKPRNDDSDGCMTVWAHTSYMHYSNTHTHTHKGGSQRSLRLRRTHHPVHRRDPPAGGRRSRRGRHGRESDAQAGSGSRAAAVHGRNDTERVQEVH